MKSTSDARSVNFDNEPEFRADILRRIGEMQRLSWEYSQKHGAPTFFQDKVAFRLPTAQMADAKLIGYRGEVSRFLSPDCVIAEIGTWKGDFAKHLIETCAPKKLYTIDLTYLRFNHEIMDGYVDRGVLQTIEGNSSLEIAKFPDAYLNFIYVDGDHSYDGILKDSAASKDKVKPGGLLAFNDLPTGRSFSLKDTARWRPLPNLPCSRAGRSLISRLIHTVITTLHLGVHRRAAPAGLASAQTHSDDSVRRADPRYASGLTQPQVLLCLPGEGRDPSLP